MVKMTNLVKNKILEMIQNSDGTTDRDLFKDISKKQPILENEFNKILLDLEIKGLISVSWLTKDTKRIEYMTIKTEDDEYDKQIKETENKDYEASFPTAD